MDSIRVEHLDGKGYDIYYEKRGRFYVFSARVIKSITHYGDIKRISKAAFMAMKKAHDTKGAEA